MEFVCDSEWTYFQPTNSCYKMGHNKNFNDANTDCMSQGANLASIHSAAESAFLVDFSKSGLTADATEVYIGLTNPGPPCTTYSWTDGTPFDYQNFAVINTCANGECTRMFPDQTVTMPTPAIGSWIGLTCSVPLRGYICKKSAQSI
uniref:C-type lectin domain-containing protein n=1 Tax=Acrobeloides nanus TaxID=290746 RepID=A0A914DDJ5_9BILA